MTTDASILAFNPFEGDFGEPGDTVLSNKMVMAAKPHECCHCKSTITKGERHRCQVSKYGDLMTHRWCSACCGVMLRIETADECDDDQDDCDVGTSAVLEFEQRAAKAAGGV